MRSAGLLHGVNDERLHQLTVELPIWKVVDGSATIAPDGTVAVDGKVLIDRNGGVHLPTAR